MAFTRNTNTDSGLRGAIRKESDGKFAWSLKETFYNATVDTKTGNQKGSLIIASGLEDDYDTAASSLKAAFTAAG
tara:strand:- start:127 stop:351 length:225 start_codon:yes stop_codon:yes gene_type:complete